jgi:hypothetical protein
MRKRSAPASLWASLCAATAFAVTGCGGSASSDATQDGSVTSNLDSAAVVEGDAESEGIPEDSGGDVTPGRDANSGEDVTPGPDANSGEDATVDGGPVDATVDGGPVDATVDGGPGGDSETGVQDSGSGADGFAAVIRCGTDGGGCPSALSCVGSYCVDCTANACPAAGETLVVLDSGGASATSADIPLATTVEKIDVAFAIDSTGGLETPLSNLESGFAGSIAQAFGSLSIAFGAVDFKDFSTDSSYVVHFDERVQTAQTTSGQTAFVNALTAISVGGGGDAPEAGWEALYAIAGGPAITIPAQSGGWPAYSSTMPSSTPQQPPTAGETQGALGGLGFRTDAMPVVISITNSEWHDAPGVAAGVPTSEDGLNDYASSLAGVPSRQAAITALDVLGARVMGFALQGGTGNPKARAAALATATGATVPTSGWPPVRPTGCAATQCCTGLNGAGEGDSPSGSGLCPLSFTMASGGTGTSSATVTGVSLLASSAPFDLSLRATDVDPGTISAFVGRIDLVTDGSDSFGCVTASSATLQDRFSGPTGTPGADGIADTVPAVMSRQPLCIRVTTTGVAPSGSAPRFVRFAVQARGIWNGGNIALGTPQEVVLLVPPN